MTSDRKLYTIGADGKNLKELASSNYGAIGSPAWSPDGKLIAYSKTDVSRSSDVYLIPSQRRRGEEDHVRLAERGQPPVLGRRHQGLFHPPRGGLRAARHAPSSQIFCVPLEKLDQGPGRARAAAGRRRPTAAGPGGAATDDGRGPVTPKTPKIDWAGLEAAHPAGHAGAARSSTTSPRNDGRTLDLRRLRGRRGRPGGPGGFGGRGGGGTPSIYTIQDNGKRMTRIATGTPRPTAGDGRRPAPRHARRLPRRHLQPAAHQGRPHPLLPGGRIGLQHAGLRRRRWWRRVRRGMAAAACGGGGRAARRRRCRRGRRPAVAAAAQRRISFNVTVRIDKPQEWDEMFDDAWRCMKYRFYDPKLHGTDWDAMRAKYKPLVAFVADRHELMNVINEMIGELNASHTGASAGRDRGAGGVAAAGVMTRHLGLDLQADAAERPVQGHPRLRRRAGRQGLDQDRQGELPDRHRRQARQGRRRLQQRSWAAGSTARSS